MDKLVKVRAEVERLKEWQPIATPSLNQLLSFIDSMQEEPSIPELVDKHWWEMLGEEPVSIWHDASEKSYKPESVVIINPNNYSGDVLINCLSVKEGRLWAYTSDLLKLDNSCKIGKDLQEEPKIPQVFDEGYWERLGEEPVSNPIDFEKELYKAFGQVKDFTLGMRIAKRFYDMGKNSQEPVSEELEEASKEWLRQQLDKSYANYGEAKMMELTHFDGYAMLDAIEFGVQWQKEQDQSTIELAEDHAMLAGMEKMKQQMMKDAVEATVTDIRTYKHENEVDFTIMLDKGIIPYETEEELKLIIIKED